MILTFTVFGTYLDGKLAEAYSNPWVGNLILAIAAIALALIVVYGLLEPHTSTPMPKMEGLSGNFRSVFAFFA